MLRAGTGASAPLIAAGGVVVTAAGVVTGAWLIALLARACARLARDGDELSMCVSLGLALVAMLLAQPLAWSHMLVLLAPAIVFAPVWLWRAGRLHVARAVAVWPAALLPLHYASKLAMRPIGWRTPYLLAWFAWTALAVVRAPGRRESPALSSSAAVGVIA